MLDIKLNVMAGWVDHFVIVEAMQTFTGRAKPLAYLENKARFAPFHHQIVHVVVERFPDHIDFAWGREFHQRDMGLRGLDGRCAADDLVMITDTDEIVSEAAVQAFRGDYARLLQERARFFLNHREALSRDRQRGLASIWKAGVLRRIGLSYARSGLGSVGNAPRLHDAGWHFTSMFDAAGIEDKFKSISHETLAGVSRGEISEAIGRVRTGEFDPGWERCELDERYPQYIRDNPDRFAHLILPARPGEPEAAGGRR